MITGDLLPHLTVGPTDADYCVIWMHGLGADGHDFEAIVPELDFRQKAKTRFIFPHAPKRAVTLNLGYVMPAWFDIYGLDRESHQDAEGIAQSIHAVDMLISAEHAKGVPTRRIVLAGFSQGGVIALHCALRYPHSLAGVIGLSTWLPLHERLFKSISPANKAIPIFLAHGTEDTTVAFTLGEHTRDMLLSQGFKPSWHAYSMPHAVVAKEIDDISAWLELVLK